MKETEVIIKDLKTETAAEYSVAENTHFFRVSELNYLKAAEYLKKQGFQRLLTVSAVDWIEKSSFEVYFIVHNLSGNIYVKVATEIPREKPRIPSLSKLWLNASMHERETWEMFQILFEGNNILEPLFLEDKVELPPFRKDFNWRDYVKKN